MPSGLRADRHPGVVQGAHRGREPGAGLPDDPVGRDEAVLEVDLTGRRAVDPQLALRRTQREPLVVGVHDERRDTRRALLRLRDGHHRVVLRDPRVGDPRLLPVEHPAAIASHRSALHRTCVRAGLPLGQGIGEHRLAAGHLGQVAPEQLVGGAHDQWHRPQLVHRGDQRAGGADPSHLLDDQAGRERVAALATELLRDVDGVEVVGAQRLVDVPRELAGLVNLRRARGDLVLGQLANGCPEHRVLLGKGECVEIRVGVQCHGQKATRAQGRTRSGPGSSHTAAIGASGGTASA